MTTTLTMAGMFGSPKAVNPMLKGELTTIDAPLPHRLDGFGPVTKVVGVRYANWLPWGQLDGREKLDAALHATKDQVIALVHSMGSYALWLWLRDKAPKSDIDPARVVFVMMGAAAHMKTAPHITGSRYRIIDVTRQYDRYADAPNLHGPNYNTAVANAKRGDSMFGQNLHTKGYLDLSLDHPDRENVIGSATYLFYNTDPCPQGDRQQIETAYDRTYLR